jgi:hypothetical protein
MRLRHKAGENTWTLAGIEIDYAASMRPRHKAGENWLSVEKS